MLLSVVVLVILTVVIAATVLGPRLLPRHIRLANTADRPRAFGSEMAWLAVRTEDASALASALGLGQLRPANWSSGIGAIYDPEISGSIVFISPPIKGWTIVAGESLPIPAGEGFVDKVTPLLQRLGGHFANVQYFAAFPIIDFYAWARFEKKRRFRIFAIGEAGVIWQSGKPTLEERRLGLSFLEVRGIRERHGDLGGELQLYPTEEHVFAIADGWSLNPMAIESSASPPGAGWIADAPRLWRPERVRKVA
ncbi:MAG: hypothetical protein JSR99_11685 [Proteobacteria bacterium]|nr:hypothetical protein [Pseudomonadota bacterium]